MISGAVTVCVTVTRPPPPSQGAATPRNLGWHDKADMLGRGVEFFSRRKHIGHCSGGRCSRHKISFTGDRFRTQSLCPTASIYFMGGAASRRHTALAVLCWASLRRISAVASRPSAAACLLLMPQPSCVEYLKDRSLDRFCSYSTLRTYCGSLSVTICVHTCTPTTRCPACAQPTADG